MKYSKITKGLIAFILLFSVISTVSLATVINSEKAKLEIAENNICTIKINDTAIFEKKIINYDLEKKEIEIQLKVTNIAEPILNKPTEIILVIDNSLSMKDEVSGGVTRLQTVTTSAKTLASELMKNDNVKLGVVSFSTGDNEGSITDATLRTAITDNSSTVLSAIESIATGSLGVRTNIDAGITLASQNFSSTCENKYIVLLTDGVPNAAIDGPILTYSAQTAVKTKAKLESLDASGINIFSVMTGVSSTVTEPSTGLTYKELAEEIFGTTENPTVGKFYYIPDTKIEETICETILSNFMDLDSVILTDLSIYDYFPQEIIDNFNFGYVTSPNIGTVSSTINLDDNCILWAISKLEPGEVAILSYKLTLKNEINSEIINIVLNTNKKVEITANEIKTDDGSDVISSEVTPKVKVTIPTDQTVANTVIPQTGVSNNSYIFIGITVVLFIGIGLRFYFINRDIK